MYDLHNVIFFPQMLFITLKYHFASFSLTYIVFRVIGIQNKDDFDQTSSGFQYDFSKGLSYTEHQYINVIILT